MTEHEELVAFGLFCIAAMLSILAVIFVWSYAHDLFWSIEAHIRPLPSDINVWFIGGTGMVGTIQFYLLQFQVRYQKQLKDRSATRRKSLHNSLTELKAKLATMKSPVKN